MSSSLQILGALRLSMPSSLVWFDYDGEFVLVNTMRERQKGKNVQAVPKVSLPVIDVGDAERRSP